MLDYLTLQTHASNPTLIIALYAILTSFVLSVAIAFTYEKTFSGLSYSRNYVQALVLSSIVASTVMQAIGDSLARGLGMIGALAIIRFRTNFKDSRDIIFMFAALAAGIGCGVNAFSVAVVGCVGFCIVAFVLAHSSFARSSYYDGVLRFDLEFSSRDRERLSPILTTHCRLFALITLREVGSDRLEYAYHVKLKTAGASDALVNQLQNELSSVSGISVMLQETTLAI